MSVLRGSRSRNAWQTHVAVTALASLPAYIPLTNPVAEGMQCAYQGLGWCSD